MFKKAVVVIFCVITLLLAGYLAFVNYVPYSVGMSSGELIKISKKGSFFKTWEGELSQGISGAQIFHFSIMSNNTDVIKQMESLQGHYVVLSYVEKYRTFSWWGDTRYFVQSVKQEKSPFKIK